MSPIEDEKAQKLTENGPTSPKKTGCETMLKPEKVTKIGVFGPLMPQNTDKTEATSTNKPILEIKKGEVTENLGQTLEESRKSDRKNPRRKFGLSVTKSAVNQPKLNDWWSKCQLNPSVENSEAENHPQIDRQLPTTRMDSLTGNLLKNISNDNLGNISSDIPMNILKIFQMEP